MSALLALEWTLRELRRELEAALAGPPLHRHVALFGSAVLARFGLRDRVGDVDLFVRPWLFARLEQRQGWALCTGEHPDHPQFLAYVPHPQFLAYVPSVAGLEVHAFQAWRADQPEIDPIEALDAAVVDVDGWPYTPLEIVRHHKAMAIERHAEYGLATPAKHVEDVDAIDAYLKRQLGGALAKREAALELLKPEARARVEAAEAEFERRVLFGDATSAEGRSDG